MNAEQFVNALAETARRLTAERDHWRDQHATAVAEAARIQRFVLGTIRERDDARSELAEMTCDREAAWSDLDRLSAEVDRMRPVLEAAAAWRSAGLLDAEDVDATLSAAVDAYRSAVGQDGAARPPQEAQDGPGAARGRLVLGCRRRIDGRWCTLPLKHVGECEPEDGDA